LSGKSQRLGCTSTGARATNARRKFPSGSFRRDKLQRAQSRRGALRTKTKNEGGGAPLELAWRPTHPAKARWVNKVL